MMREKNSVLLNYLAKQQNSFSLKPHVRWRLISHDLSDHLNEERSGYNRALR